MYLFLDSENRVQGVNNYKIAPDKANLKKVHVDETDPNFPFKNKSDALICCYKVAFDESTSTITEITPYISTSLFPLIDVFGKLLAELNSKLEGTADAIAELAEIVYGEGGDDTENLE